jgi:hypothetical protein
MDVNKAKALHVDELMAVQGVVGVAVGREGGEDVILLLVESLTGMDTPVKLGAPPRLEGFRVIVREVGRLDAQS